MKKFWDWYQAHYQLNLIVSTFLFLLQLFHLYWMATYVVAMIVFHQSFFFFPPQFGWLYALVDYSEIPALISVGLIYVHDIKYGKKKSNGKNWLYLFFLNIQWVHLFWITDTVVVAQLIGNTPVAIPSILAYIAIGIDFLELPVMVETSVSAVRSIFGKSER